MDYTSLFNIKIHHGYFLDQGERKFLAIHPEDDESKLDDDEKNDALDDYDFSNFLRIKPTSYTQEVCKNYRMIARQTAEEFKVLIATKEDIAIIPLEDDISLTFEMQVKDPYFYNYTNIASLLENKMYLFSNVIPQDQAALENIFENEDKPVDNNFLLDKQGTRNLLKSIAEEDNALLSVKDQFSIVHAIQLIQDNASFENQAEKDIEIAKILDQAIQVKKRQKIVGYIRLTIKGDNNNNLPTYAEGVQSNTVPSFTISFVNRKTHWKFIDRTNNINLETTSEKWLSKNGFIEIIGKSTEDTPSDFDPEPTADYVFPNPTIDSITHDENTDKYYSEIFI